MNRDASQHPGLRVQDPWSLRLGPLSVDMSRSGPEPAAQGWATAVIRRLTTGGMRLRVPKVPGLSSANVSRGWPELGVQGWST